MMMIIVDGHLLCSNVAQTHSLKMFVERKSIDWHRYRLVGGASFAPGATDQQANKQREKVDYYYYYN